MTAKKNLVGLLAATLGASALSASAGGYTIKGEDGAYLKFGGRVQVQYHQTDPESGSSTDSLFFRRLRPFIEGSTHEDWVAKFQVDFGKSGTEIKDMYFQYKGFDWGKVTVGNYAFAFSREYITSSEKQGLVERTFVGDHNYGTPDRQVGIHLASVNEGFSFWASAAMGALDPDNKKLDFESVSSLEKGDDFLEGPMVGARFEVHPMGKVDFAQGELSGTSDFKAALGFAAFTWSNDGDLVNTEDVVDEMGVVTGTKTSKKDVDSVTGFEISAAIRVAGLSVDAQYNSFDAETVLAGVTDGIYKGGETTLENMAVEAGYMLIPNTLELMAGYSTQDADNYADAWERTEVGLNYYVAKYDVKFQATYRMNENKDGKVGNDVDEVFVQAQVVF